jgi:hypothetical protein
VKAVRPLAARARRVTRGRFFLPAAAVVALAVAVFAALVAQDVRSWRNTLRDDAIRYAVSPSAQQRWTAPTYLPAGLSARLLGIAPDRRRLSALRFFALAAAVDISAGVTPRTESLLQTSEKALARVAQDPNPALASQAYALLSAILFKDSKGSFVQDLATYSASISAMQNAVRVDPGNEQAEADLELLQRQFLADSTGGDQQEANNQGSRRRAKTVGRGQGVPPLNAPGGDY